MPFIHLAVVLFSFLMVDIHAFERSIPVSLLISTGLGLMWVASSTLHNIPIRIMINELEHIPKQVVPGFVGLVTDNSEYVLQDQF